MCVCVRVFACAHILDTCECVYNLRRYYLNFHYHILQVSNFHYCTLFEQRTMCLAIIRELRQRDEREAGAGRVVIVGAKMESVRQFVTRFVRPLLASLSLSRKYRVAIGKQEGGRVTRRGSD